jgi:PKD repeat protein
MGKSKGLAIGIGITLLIVGFLLIYYFSPAFISKDNKNPDAIININVANSQELLINKGDTIHFSAKNSTDEDGEIEEYLWNFGDGSSSDDMDAKHTYDEPGTYNVTLTVVDDDGNKDIKYLEITVNSPPNAIIKVLGHQINERISIPIARQIQFMGNDSTDPDGWIESYHWSFGDGNESTLETPVHYYFQLGNFQVTLTVTDNTGAKSLKYLEIESIKRTYVSKWTVNYYEIVVENNGYTREGQSTENIYDLQQDKISTVTINFTWEDRQPFLRDNETEGEDLFELGVITPENNSLGKNSTAGNISINVPYNSKPISKQFKANTESDAITAAEEIAELSSEGNGEWYFNVTAILCKGGNWVSDQFDLDVGNSWSLILIIHYFELEMVEITNETG